MYILPRFGALSQSGRLIVFVFDLHSVVMANCIFSRFQVARASPDGSALGAQTVVVNPVWSVSTSRFHVV